MIKNLDLDKIPKVLAEIIKISRIITPDVGDNIRLAITMPLIGHVIAFKRIKIDEFNDGKNLIHFNVYVLVFLGSGGGKDVLKNLIQVHILPSSLKVIDEYVKKFYKEKREKLIEELNQTEDKIEKNEIRKKIQNLRQIDLIVNKCTNEGFNSDAHSVSEMPLGSIILIDGEFGITLLSKDDKAKQPVECLIQAYDGKVADKSIKMENQKLNKIFNLIINCLLYSDPELFRDKKTNEFFKQISEIGVTRRSFIVYQDKVIKTKIENQEIEYERKKQAYSICEKIDKMIFDIFSAIPENAVYKLPRDVYLKHLAPYKSKLTDLFNKSKIELERKEILSRELKALKMAVFCASLNHPDKLIINDVDFEQAIYITEFLSQGYQNFLDFSSPYNDYHNKVYDFLKENINRVFKKTELINCHKQIGISRGFFRKEFDNIIMAVKEMALDNGYDIYAEVIKQTNAITLQFIKQLTPEEKAELYKDLEVHEI